MTVTLSFAISDAPTKPVKLKDDSGTFTVKVTNTAAQQLAGTVLVKPQAPATLDWFAIAGEATRRYPPGDSEKVAVTIAPPPNTTPATYSVRIDAKGEDVPDEDYTDGPEVQFVVPEPKPPVPWWRKYWWVFAIVLLIIVLPIVLIAVF